MALHVRGQDAKRRSELNAYALRAAQPHDAVAYGSAGDYPLATTKKTAPVRPRLSETNSGPHTGHTPTTLASPLDLTTERLT
jgi:hypothetical protein